MARPLEGQKIHHGPQGKGLLCKETHETIIRFAPPLVITKKEIDDALAIIKEVFA